MLKRFNQRFRILAWLTIFVMIVTQFSGIFTYIIQANEDILLFNEFIKCEINPSNGRYSIGTMEGTITRDDSNQAMLFDEYEPETTFTTFKIDGQEYIFGNDYGFLGDDGYFKELPSSNNEVIQDGYLNSCTWVIKGVEIEQRLEVTDTHQDAGNVKISYLVNNKSGVDIEIGSRILLDTMLGSNDGAPIKMPGSSAFIQTEKRYIGEDIPLFWNAYAGNQDLDMMTYGIVEGWQEQYIAEGKSPEYCSKPDELVVAHWNSLSATKWEFVENNLLDFSSENNQYGTSDSAVAMYWNVKTLVAGEERLYETYYGLGKYATAEKKQLLDFNVYAPTEVQVLEDNTDYADETIEITGDVSHHFIDGETLENTIVSIQYNEEGLIPEEGQFRAYELGSIPAEQLESFIWTFVPDQVTEWETFTYEVHLNADNIAETIIRRGEIIVPPVHGAVPDIQMETIAPGHIYYLDEDNSFIIKGHGLDALKGMDDFSIDLVLHEVKDSEGNIIKARRVINNADIDMFIKDDHVQVQLPSVFTTDDLGYYDVVLQYQFGDIKEERIFDNGIEISDDPKYSKKFYSILLVIRHTESFELGNLEDDQMEDLLGGMKLDEIGPYIEEHPEILEQYPILETSGYLRWIKSLKEDDDYNKEDEISETFHNVIDDEVWYEIVAAKDENEINNYNTEDVMLEVRGPKLYEADGIYYIDKGRCTINSILTIDNTITLPLALYEYSDDGDEFVVLEGLGGMFIDQMPFMFGPFEILLKQGVFYTVDDEEKEEDTKYQDITVNLAFYKSLAKVEEDSIGTVKKSILAVINTDDETQKQIKDILEFKGFPIKLKDAILRRDSITFGGSIDLQLILDAMINASESKQKKKEEETKAAEKKEADKSKSPEQLETEKKIEEINKKNEADEKQAKKIEDLFKEEDEESDEFQLKTQFVIALEELKFGSYKNEIEFRKLAFSASVGLDAEALKKLVPGLDDDIGGSFKYDLSIAQERKITGELTDLEYAFSILGKLNVEVLTCDTELVIKSMNIGGVPVPMIDKIFVYAGIDPGIPLIPPTTVGFLKGGGGGISGITDTIMGDFNILPPLKLSILASAEVVGIEAEKARLDLSARGVKLNIEKLKFGRVDIFENVGLSATIADDPRYLRMTLAGYGSINVYEVLKGSARVSFSYDETYNGHFGHVKLYGGAKVAVFVPRQIPLIGGRELAGAGIGISDIGVAGTAYFNMPKIWFFQPPAIPFGFSYKWSAMGVGGLDEVQLVSEGLCSQPVFDESGAMIGMYNFGTNFTVAYDSYSNNAIASTEGMPELFYDGQAKEHSLTMNDFDFAIIEVKPLRYQPTMTLTSPEGKEYPLIEGETYVIRETGTDELIIDIAIGETVDGTWTLTSSDDIAVKMYKVDAVPDITLANSTLINNNLSVTWEGTLLEDRKVAVYLVDDTASDNQMTLLGTVDNGADGSFATLIPSEIMTGNYKLELQVQEDEKTVTDIYTLDKELNYLAADAPEGVSNLILTNEGQGRLGASWDDLGASDGTFIQVLDALSGEIIQDFELEEDINDVVFGGGYESEDGENNTLEPGKTYVVSIGNYNNVDGFRRNSSTISKSIIVNKPNPATLTYVINSLEDTIIDQGVKEELQNYSSREESVDLSITSDQEVELAITHNGEFVYTESGTDFNIPVALIDGDNGFGIMATNLSGDQSDESFNLIYDNHAPILFIEQPLQGSVHKTDFSLSGYSEYGAKLTLNGNPLEVDSDGVFSKSIKLEDAMVQTLTITATDAAGHVSTYISEVFNGNILNVKNIEIVPATNQIEIGKSVDYNVVIVDLLDQEYLVDDSLINWSILSDAGLISVNDKGIVTGNALGLDSIIASYSLSDDYVLDDGLLIEIVDQIKETDYIKCSPDLIGLGVGEEYYIRTYETYIDTSNRMIDTRLLTYEVLTGKSVIDINDNGLITSKEEGKAIVLISYEKNEVVFESYAIVMVSNEQVEKMLGRLTEEDLFIINALKGVVRYEAKRRHQVAAEAMNTEGAISQITLPDSFIELAFMKEDADKRGNKSIYVELPSVFGTKEYQVTLSKGVLAASSFNTIVIETDIGNILLPTNMLERVTSTSGLEYELDQGSIEKEDYDKQLVTITIREAIIESDDSILATRPAIDVSIYEGVGNKGEKLTLDSPEAYIDIELAYGIKSSEEANYIGVASIEEDGSTILIPTTMYHETIGKIVFRTNHLSTFCIIYQELSYDDLNTCTWSKEAVKALSSKGVISCEDSNNFYPNSNIDIVELLEWLHNALNWIPNADLQLEINKDKFVSREEMMRLIAIAYKEISHEPTNTEFVIPSCYIDKCWISDSVKDEVTFMVEKGFIVGDLYNLEPKRLTTKAEVAVVLWRVFKDLY